VLSGLYGNGAPTLSGVELQVTTATEWWYVNVAPPSGGALAVGTYDGAQRAAFRSAGAPGLDVYGDGRGCNQVFGSFTVDSITTDASGTVTEVALRFTQNCETATAPPLNGDVQWQVPPPATSTALQSSAASVAPGTAVTFTATVAAASGGGATPTGSVSFSDGPTQLGTAGVDGSGNAALTVTTLALGTHSVAASYGGDATYAPSTSPAVTVTVTKYPTSTALTASATTVKRGSPETLTATVTSGGSPSGTARFLDGTTVLGSATLSGGRATLVVTFSTVGTHTLTATYSGDAANSPSTSPAVTVGVTKH
jgi:Big-like domain-containing protein